MKTNYLKLYEDIIKFYPFGISPFDPMYNQYSGSILLQELCSEKLKPSAYNKWKSLVKGVKDENQRILRSEYESPLLYPCYCGNLILAKEKKGSLYYTRELIFHLSIIAPYFTIYGMDKVALKSDSQLRTVFEPILYLAPMDIYEYYFKIVRKRIEETYGDYTFISHSLLSKRINSLIVAGSNVKEGQFSSVFQALFTLDDVTNYKGIGDIWYE